MYLKWLLSAAIVVNLVMKTVQQHVYLWKITHPARAKPSYLFGTMHVPWKILFDKIPVENIIKNVDVVVMEINNKEAPKLRDYIKAREAAELPENIVKQIQKNFSFCHQSALLDLPSDWLLLSLSNLSMRKQLNVFDVIFWASLDDKITKIGKRKRKETRYLETPEDLRIFLPNIKEESMSVLIEEALDIYEKDKNTLKTLVQLYKNGEYTEQKLLNPDHGLTFTPEKEAKLKIARNEFLADLFATRNKKWVLKMNEWMMAQNRKSFFFAVGLGHIITEHESLIELLTEKGYTVEKMQNVILSDATKEDDDDDLETKDNQKGFMGFFKCIFNI